MVGGGGGAGVDPDVINFSDYSILGVKDKRLDPKGKDDWTTEWDLQMRAAQNAKIVGALVSHAHAASPQ